jgi:hypothetical protein
MAMRKLVPLLAVSLVLAGSPCLAQISPPSPGPVAAPIVGAEVGRAGADAMSAPGKTVIDPAAAEAEKKAAEAAKATAK